MCWKKSNLEVKVLIRICVEPRGYRHNLYPTSLKGKTLLILSWSAAVSTFLSRLLHKVEQIYGFSYEGVADGQAARCEVGVHLTSANTNSVSFVSVLCCILHSHRHGIVNIEAAAATGGLLGGNHRHRRCSSSGCTAPLLPQIASVTPRQSRRTVS